MIQLSVQVSGTGWIFLDTYDLEPIRLNLVFDSFDTFKPQSSYSQSFRLPATVTNYDFFKTAFDVNGYDFDVTQKRNARILVDGDEFIEGEIRLLKIYNSFTENPDYECVFYGTTRNLISNIGSKKLRDLNTSSLNHTQSMSNVSSSWNAYPTSTNLTNGLLSGNVVYPLIDFGNTYDDAEVPQEVSVSLGNGLHISNSALDNSSKIWADRFKPMVRIKYLLDRIFTEAGCIYKSDYIGDINQTPEYLPFYRTYLTAWGNEDSIFCPVDSDKTQVTLTNQFTVSSSTPVRVEYNNVSYDYNNSWSEDTFIYTSQVAGLVPFTVKLYGTFDDSEIASVGIKRNGTVLSALTQASGTGVMNYYQTFTLNLVVGDVIEVYAAVTGGDIQFTSGFFRTDFAAEVNISSLFQENYKQIDFLRDVMTAFKLVLVPDRENPNNYFIEPWNRYIGSGNTLDWTSKLDTSKDIAIEPMFYEQKSVIKFETAEDKDWLNDLNQKTFKENFGTLNLDANNPLLSDEKIVKLNLSPNPVTEIQGAAQDTTWGRDNMVISHIFKLEPGDTRALKEPIVPKHRLLYYNGLKNTGTTTGRTLPWYYRSDVNTQVTTTTFPMATPYLYMPYPYEAGGGADVFGDELNWQSETGYLRFRTLDPTISLYDNYWIQYVNLIYNKYSRRVTAYFVLSNEDLFDFNFNDVIFVKDAYYFVEKIENLLIGQRESTRVSLIKLIDYNPDQSGYIPPLNQIVWEDVLTNWDATTDAWGAF